jgi:hypothetical protein
LCEELQECQLKNDSIDNPQNYKKKSFTIIDQQVNAWIFFPQLFSEVFNRFHVTDVTC